jgi:cap1 methyltransferase
MNRAGKKLSDIMELRPELYQYTRFLDIAGAPGNWSLLLLEKEGVRGSGISIECGDQSRHWYAPLRHNPNWIELKHENCDITKVSVIDYILADNTTYDLIVADGAPDEKEYKNENLQELYASRIILSEVYICFKKLEIDGNFILKMFDTFTPLTIGILYFMTYNFKSTEIVKPQSSRALNSERYIICIGKISRDDTNVILDIMYSVLLNCMDEKIPKAIIQPRVVDSSFMATYCKITRDLATKQINALDYVCRELDNVLQGADITSLQSYKGKSKGKGKGKSKGGNGKSKGKNGKRGGPYSG